MQFIVRDDGPYAVINGREVYLDGVLANVLPDGSLVIRAAARDVTVAAPIIPERHIDFTDVVLCITAVVKGGLTIAQIAAVRPGMAVAVQTFMTNHGLVAGGAT